MHVACVANPVTNVSRPLGSSFEAGRGALLVLTGIMLVFLFTPAGLRAQLSGAYTIDNTQATAGSNYNSFNAAISALTTSGVSGAVTFTVASSTGPYTEHLSIPSISGANSTNTITFDGNNETLQFTPTSTDWSIIDLNGADYVKFTNLSITGVSNTYGVGVHLRNQANYNEVSNCTITLPITSTSAYSAYVLASSSLTSMTGYADNANNNTFQNNTMQGSGGGGPYYAIRLNGSSSTVLSTGNAIIGNTIQDQYNYGVYGYYTNGTVIRGNDISRPNRTASISTFYGIYLSTGCLDNVIEQNKVHGPFGQNPTVATACYGIYISSTSAGSGTENEVKNNLIYDMQGSSTCVGIYLTSAVFVQVYHNTINLDYSSATAGTTYGIYTSASGTTTGPDILNNIVTITRAGTGTKYCLYFSSTSTSTSNHNDLYINCPAGTNYIGYWNASTASTLVAWQALNTNKYDQASVSVDPLYENTSSGNLKPQESTVNNIGTDLLTGGYVTVDILGNPRTTTPDPGAYEFTPSVMTVSGTTTTQTVTDPVLVGATDQLIIGIEIQTTGVAAPLTATQFSLSTSGTTSAGDIASAKLYYTGSSSTFATTTTFGSATSPSGSFAITGSQTLTAGVNYFWLAYDISSGATACNAVDAECSSITVGGTPYTPTPTAPTGTRTIRQPFSGSVTINSAATPACAVYSSLNQFISDLKLLGVSGAVTVNVAASSGPYVEHLSIDPIPGASSTNTITFNGNGNSIEHQPATGDYTVIDLNGCDYVTFNNFTIKGTDATYGIGILLRNQANNNRILNCTIDLTAVGTGSTTAFIAASNSLTSTTTTGDNANNCTIQGNTFLGNTGGGGPYYGIRLNGSSTAYSSTNVIDDNTIQYCYYYPIYLNYTDGNTVIDNTIEDSYTYNITLAYTTNGIVRGNDISRPTRTAVSTFYGIYASTGTASTVIEKNRVHNAFAAALTSTSTSYPMYITSTTASSGNEITIKNNLIYDIQGSGTIYGIYQSSTTGTPIRMYHNTINLDYAAATGGTTYAIYAAATGAGPDIQNNIINIGRGGTGTKACLYLPGLNGTTSNYNDLLITSTAGTNYTGSYNGTGYATLANWQTANSNAFDQQSVSADPQYENPPTGNFKPQDPGVNNAGANLSTAGCTCVTDDILGNSRSTTPDIGAYEFSPSSMTVSSSNTTQNMVAAVLTGSSDQLIIGIRITTLGALPPAASVTQFNFSTNGSTSAGDITAAKLYYTSNSDVFAATGQFGSTYSSPSGAFVITGTQTLSPGVNYFWLAYDISPTATACNVVDAECSSITVNSTGYTPTTTAPTGSRTIKTQFNGTYTINSAGTPSCTLYTSIREAAEDLNALGVSGPVTFNVIAGHTETSANIVLQVPSASATNTITFQKSGSGSNPLITADAGTGTLDGIVKIVGTDYITFDAIDVQESSLNTTTTTQMEWGYAILKSSGTTVDGSQHVTIKNCTISLNRANTSSRGIYQYNHTDASTTTLTVTSLDGTSSYNRFYNNDISNVYMGIYLYGYSSAAYYDIQNEIGGIGNGNSITNFGGAGSTCYGIYTVYQTSLNIGHNTLDNQNAGTTTHYGIYASTATNGNTEIFNNTITMVNNSTVYGIYNSSGTSGGGNTVSIHDNTITNCTVTGTLYGIYFTASASNGLVYGNTFSSSSCTSTLYGFYLNTSPTGTSLWYDNTLSNLTTTGASTVYGLYHTLATTTTGATYGNTVSGLTSSGGSGSVYAVYLGSGLTHDVYKNNIFDISSATGLVRGMYLTSSTTTNIYNNFISDVKSPGGTAGGTSPSVVGIWNGATSGAVNMYYNTVYLDASSTSTSFGSAAVYSETGSTTEYRNNVFVNVSTPGASSATASTMASIRSANDLPTYVSTSNNNCFYAGTPGTNNLIFYDGTNSDQTITQYRTRVSPRDTYSATENPPFLNVATTPYNLHMSPSAPTQTEGGGSPVTTPIAVGDDFDATTRNATYPDIGADEFSGITNDQLPPAIAYTPMLNGAATSTRAFSGVTITDKNGVNGTAGTRPRVYYKKGGSNNQNLWNDNTNSSEGWKYAEASGTSSPFDFTINYTLLPGGSVSVGDTIQYFVVAQDQWTTPNVGIVQGYFTAQPSSVALTSAAFPITGTIHEYRIAAPISGTVSVGSGQTYTTLTATGGLFETINNSVLSGDLTVNISSDISTEDGTHGLNPVAGGYRVQIQSSSATTYTLSGTATQSLFRLNGADNVTIDGTNSTTPGRYLVFRNTNNGYPTMELLNDATMNRVMNCVIEGGTTGSASGVIVFGDANTGNSYNSFIGCDIRDRSDVTAVPANLVYSSNAMNAADTLKNNLLHDYTAEAVALDIAGDNWQILTNGVYQTAGRSTALRGISILSGSGHTILANNIGGSAADRSGSPLSTTSSFYAIYLTLGSTAQTTVSNNVIGNLNIGSTTGGIYITGGDVSVTHNRIGTVTASSDTVFAVGTVYGIYNSVGPALAVSTDTLGFITGSSTMYGIYSAGGNNTISGNLLRHISGGSTCYGIYVSSTGINTITNNLLADMTTWGTHYSIYSLGTMATTTVTGNTVQDTWQTSQTGTGTLAGIYITATGTNTVTSNTVQRLNQASQYWTTPTSSVYGIYLTSGVWNTVSSNTVDSIRNETTKGAVRGMYLLAANASSGMTVAGNTVSRLWSINNESPPAINKGTVYGVWAAQGIDTVMNNTVFSINTAAYDSAASTFGVLGLVVNPATAGNVVRGNTVDGIHNHDALAEPTPASGMYVAGVQSPTIVEKNRIYNITVASTGTSSGSTAPSIDGISAAAGSNATFSNNMVSVGIDVVADAEIAGIREYSGTGTNAYFYNSVYVGGTVASGGSTTTAFNRTGTSTVTTVTLANNIFFNGRTGGTTNHYAVMNPGGATNWSSSDYNLFVSLSPAAMGLWETTDCGISAWRTNSSGDTYSLYAASTSLGPTVLFTDIWTANLNIVNTNPECWYVNGKGIAGAASGSIADDFGAASVRSTTLGMATDIGADEFNTTTTPPAATASGAPATSTTTTYSFGSLTLCAISWGAAGTVPSAIDLRYYSGNNPPGPLQGNYANAYAAVSATGGSGYTYDITFPYSPAFLGTIGSESNIRIAKRDAGVWTAYLLSLPNTSLKTVTHTGLTSFSDFTFTDAASPLPVELTAFTAILRGSAVDLAWKTASEFNTLRFAIERSIDRLSWQEIGSVAARGTVDAPISYAWTDERLPATDVAYYRLRIVDRDGTYEHSAIERVSLKLPKSLALEQNYPNPFNAGTRITFALPEESFVKLTVYDMTGRQVRTLVSEVKPAGNHATMFDPTDLPSGLYRCVLNAGGGQAVIVMSLLR